MISLTSDPANPERLVLTATVTLYLEKVLFKALSEEIETAIRQRAIADLKGNPAVRAAVGKAASSMLLEMLDVNPPKAQVPIPPVKGPLEQL